MRGRGESGETGEWEGVVARLSRRRAVVNLVPHACP